MLYRHLTNDIPGFQNRFGLFFFVLTFFAFLCLTLLSAMASERDLFARERANGYYATAPYFASRVLFDVLPLRVLPPFLFGGLVYLFVDLNPSRTVFWHMNLVLGAYRTRGVLMAVLFSLASSSCVLLISVAIAHMGVANLTAMLTMLFSMLFAGLLINSDQLPQGLHWIQHLSFFHAAFEALALNELSDLHLTQHKFGIDIEVRRTKSPADTQIPAATVLSSFGFVRTR